MTKAEIKATAAANKLISHLIKNITNSAAQSPTTTRLHAAWESAKMGASLTALDAMQEDAVKMAVENWMLDDEMMDGGKDLENQHILGLLELPSAVHDDAIEYAGDVFKSILRRHL